MLRSIWTFLPLLGFSIASAQEPVQPVQPIQPGHSTHGAAFDSGLRSRPHLMPGVGNAPFAISTKNAEVQQYFSQANALMHSFWWEEAERSLRWCLKLEPDNAMVYWGLARSGDGNMSGRYRDFLNEAIKRKGKVSLRERAYIEAWEDAYAKGVTDSDDVLRKRLQKIVLQYPDDLEAKAQLAWTGPREGDEYLHDLLVRQIQTVNPAHPGAVHSTIHGWDYQNPLQAIESAEKYAKFAPRVGHALHMPGHIYSKIGMWHEAARAMDSATRTELRYMNERLALPFETWNFQHNRNYLCFIQEQLGMAESSLRGARDLLAAPTDPRESNDIGGGFVWQGRSAFIRASLKFERYDNVLKPGAVPYEKNDDGKELRAWVECVAYARKGDAINSRKQFQVLDDIVRKSKGEKTETKVLDRPKDIDDGRYLDLKEAEALTLIAEGKLVDGRKALIEASNLERAMRDKQPIGGDPPNSAWSTARILGDFHLKQGEPKLAIEAYDRALRYEPNDGFALSGLALAYHAAGDDNKAREYAGRLEYEWSNADPGLHWLTDVQALKLNPKPIAVTPRSERPYRPAELARYGPSNWEPFAAPKLECLNVNGKPVNLTDYRGKNVLLVFYLSDSCVHCVEQLAKINGRMADFEKENTVVLGVSSTSPDMNRASLKLGSMSIKLLSDKNHENARRFASYDDFEDMELHSTILIDPEGRIRWKRTGGDPFSDVDYLLREIRHTRGVR